jgi:hypothetical protein
MNKDIQNLIISFLYKFNILDEKIEITIKNKEYMEKELLWIFKFYARGHPIARKKIIRSIYLSVHIYLRNLNSHITSYRVGDITSNKLNLYFTNYGKDNELETFYVLKKFGLFHEENYINNINQLYRTKVYKTYNLLKINSDINLVLCISYFSKPFRVKIVRFINDKYNTGCIISSCLYHNIKLKDIMFNHHELSNLINSLIV